MILIDMKAKNAENSFCAMNRILLVDDHPLLREGLGRLIDADSGLSVCAMAGSVQEALSMVESTEPDLVITDLTLPGRNGLELIKDLLATHPQLPVIVLSMHDELIYAERVLRAGGRGYVMKDSPPERLLEAIYMVLGGGRICQPVRDQSFPEGTFLRQRTACTRFPAGTPDRP